MTLPNASAAELTFLNSQDYNSTQQIFGIGLNAAAASHFSVDPENTNVAAGTSNNNFVWIFTAENSSGDSNIRFTIPDGFTAPEGHVALTPGSCDEAYIVSIVGQEITISQGSGCRSNENFALTYYHVTVPQEQGVYTFHNSRGTDPTVTVGGGTSTPTGTPSASQTGTPSGTPSASPTGTPGATCNTAFVYNAENRHLLSINLENGDVIRDIPLNGMDGDEVLMGIDFRPATGQLYTVISNGTTDYVATIIRRPAR